MNTTQLSNKNESAITEIVDENNCSSTNEYEYHKYPFEGFNRVQSTILQNGFHEQDANLVLGTTTSSGKTISAELFMGKTLFDGGKVIYCSPLKSLTQEKYSDWQKTFSNYKICILTGDYTLNKEREKELNEADIICVTSEMLDSRTRNYLSEKSEWMFKARLVVVDESHIISTQRGHAVEVGLGRFAKLVKQARILLLSATMPNILDFKQWLTNINGKHTNVINSSWRPTELEWHFIYHSSFGGYREIEEDKLRLARKIIMEKPNEKYLVFCWSKTQGRQLESQLKNLEIDCKFHNADLSLKDRLEVEKEFEKRENGLRILISSSTLAWGRSLPARNVVIVGTKRGINEVDIFDIIQASGRAGRFGIDPKGDTYLICDSTMWEQKVKNPRKVTSELMNKDLLGFHLLSEIKNKEIYDKRTLNKWFDLTLAKVQKPVDYDLVNESLLQLEKWGMLYINVDGIFNITRIGLVSANLYFLPRDVIHWKSGFNHIKNNNLWKSDLALSYVIGSTPSYSLPYVPQKDKERVEEYSTALATKWGRYPAFESLMACDLYDLMQGYKPPITINNLRHDIERLTQAFTWLDSICQWHQTAIWKTLPIRVQKGVGRELVALCEIDGIGAVRAKKLFEKGFKSRMDLLENKETLAKIVGRNISEKIISQIKQNS